MSEIVKESAPDFSDALTSGRYKRVSVEWAQKNGYFPNELWHSEQDRTTLIVAKSSNYPDGDFALNAKAVKDLAAKMEEGRIAAAYVLFVENNAVGRKVFGHRRVDALAKLLAGRSPVEGKHGAFYWITRETASENGGYVPSELEPI